MNEKSIIIEGRGVVVQYNPDTDSLKISDGLGSSDFDALEKAIRVMRFRIDLDKPMMF